MANDAQRAGTCLNPAEKPKALASKPASMTRGPIGLRRPITFASPSRSVRSSIAVMSRLGTDGSAAPTRGEKKLRNFFEVDRRWVTH